MGGDVRTGTQARTPQERKLQENIQKFGTPTKGKGKGGGKKGKQAENAEDDQY